VTGITESIEWEPEPGDVVGGRYEIEQFLGAGGFAKAFRARDTRTGDVVAIKHPNYVSSQNDRDVIEHHFQQEVDSLERIADVGGHENVMSLYDSVRDRGLRFLVVEFVTDGTELNMFIAEQGPIKDTTQIRQIGIGLADALGFLHKNEIVYRDLKPENVMIRPDGTPLLIDFNTATGIGSSGADSGTTILGPFKPTEVTDAGRSDVRQGPWSDVYSIGKILFYLLKGSVPNKHGVDPREFGADCEPEVAEIIERATRSAYRDRYRNATVLRNVLAENDPAPSTSATLRYLQADTQFTVTPGDTVGRTSAPGPSPSIAIEDPEGAHISAVQFQIETADDGWRLIDRSLNGTFVQKGSGWRWVLCPDGRTRLREHGEDYTDRHGNRPPESLRLADGDLIAVVHPTYGVAFEFHT
jgi:protein kinase/serine/threonine-protein kinase